MPRLFGQADCFHAVGHGEKPLPEAAGWTDVEGVDGRLVDRRKESSKRGSRSSLCVFFFKVDPIRGSRSSSLFYLVDPLDVGGTCLIQAHLEKEAMLEDILSIVHIITYIYIYILLHLR